MRKKEHESKVRLTKQDIKNGKLESAEQRMGKEDGGLARHSVKCKGEIEWEKAEVVAMEKGLRQRKAREGIESLREQQSGREALNNFEQSLSMFLLWFMQEMVSSSSCVYCIFARATNSYVFIFVCVGVMYSGEYDVCDVTLSVYPHRTSLKNMPGHGGNRTYD